MKIRKIVAVIATAGLLGGGYAMAAEPTNFDYTGLPVTDTSVDEAVRYTTIPSSLIMPECEVVENQDDYTGVEATRCAPNGDADLEWSYLY